MLNNFLNIIFKHFGIRFFEQTYFFLRTFFEGCSLFLRTFFVSPSYHLRIFFEQASNLNQSMQFYNHFILFHF